MLDWKDGRPLRSVAASGSLSTSMSSFCGATRFFPSRERYRERDGTRKEATCWHLGAQILSLVERLTQARSLSGVWTQRNLNQEEGGQTAREEIRARDSTTCSQSLDCEDDVQLRFRFLRAFGEMNSAWFFLSRTSTRLPYALLPFLLWQRLPGLIRLLSVSTRKSIRSNSSHPGTLSCFNAKTS